MTNKDLGLLNAQLSRDHLSHAPNSKFRVGVYLEGDKLNFHAGNIEHENSMLNICAERLALALAKGKKVVPIRMHLISDSPIPVMPCGVCRQYMAEFPKLQLICWSNDGSESRVKTTKQLYPLPYSRK